MMIGTSFGVFYPTLRDPKTITEGDTRNIQIRARRKYDLDMLRTEYIPTLGETMSFKYSDYQFRAFCTQDELANALAMIALDMDYTKFKHTPFDKFNDEPLLRLYEAFWNVHLEAFPNGSIYGDLRRPTRGTKSAKRGNARGNTNGQWWWDETVNFTSIDDLSPSAKQQLWEMSESDRQHRNDQEPEVWSDEFQPEMANGPRETENGSLDHSLCTHENSKSARRRCRKAYAANTETEMIDTLAVWQHENE